MYVHMHIYIYRYTEAELYGRHDIAPKCLKLQGMLLVLPWVRRLKASEMPFPVGGPGDQNHLTIFLGQVGLICTPQSLDATESCYSYPGVYR